MLPKINHPTITVELPISKEKITLRPMTVREEKLLMFSRQTNDFSKQIESLIQILESCVSEKIDFKNLWIYDLKVIILKLSSLSVDEKLVLYLSNQNNKLDLQSYEVVLDINEVIKTNNEKIKDFTDTVALTDTLSVKLNPMSLKLAERLNAVGEDFEKRKQDRVNKILEEKKKTNPQITVDQLTDDDLEQDLSDFMEEQFQELVTAIQIDRIYDGDTTIEVTDDNLAEFTEWVGSLGKKYFNKISDAIAKRPDFTIEIEYETEWKNLEDEVIKEKNNLVISAIQHFFIW